MDLALPCFISSAISAGSLVDASFSSVNDLAPFDISAEIDLWKASGQGLVEPEGEKGFRQRDWDNPRIELIQENLLNNANQFS